VLLEVMARISEALEPKRSNMRTITIDAKAVN